MRDLMNKWFEPVLDSDGRRIPFRTSRPALALFAASLACYGATILLLVLELTDHLGSPWWPVTYLAAPTFGSKARTRLRQAVQT